MRYLTLNFYCEVKTEDDVNRLKKIKDDFNLSRVDDFMMYWVIFLYYFPLPNKLQRVFDKQDTISQKLGIVSRHLIKTAKKEDVDQYLIDKYVEAKHEKNTYHYKFLHKEVERYKEKFNKLSTQDKKFSTMINAVRYLEDYSNKIRMIDRNLNRYTFDMIKHTVPCFN